MPKQNLSAALCQKVSDTVKVYIQKFPQEWEAFKIQQRGIRGNLRTKWAEVNGNESVVVREILQMPETLHNMLKMVLEEAEEMEFQEEKYKIWFANTFPDFKSIEGKL